MKRKFLRNRLCQVVLGYNRALVYDLTRFDHHYIPIEIGNLISTNELIEFPLNKLNDYTLEWITFLEEKEIIFEADFESDEDFPALNLHYEDAHRINCLVIHDNVLVSKIQKLFNQVIIPNLTIIASRMTDKLFDLLSKITILEINDIHLYLTSENVSYTVREIRRLRKYSNISNIILFNSLIIDLEERNLTDLKLKIVKDSFQNYSEQTVTSKLGINKELFLEAQQHHTYFNKKVYIDELGNIKNGYSSQISHGEINSVSKEAFFTTIQSQQFQKYWAVSKTNTLVCCDCEFKFMCVDSRILNRNKDKFWYHSTECNYNPYLSKWKEEQGYKTLKESGVTISKEGNLTISKVEIKMNFQNAWNED